MPRTALILEGGLSTFHVARGIPSEVTPPLEATFGELDTLLRAGGWQTHHAGTAWSPQDLVGISVLMVINPQKEPSGAQTLAVRRFLARGGRLLVIGDHTDIFGIRLPLNRYLEACSIRFNYDSAIPLPDAPEWFKGMQMAAYAPPFADLDDKTIGISVGASLTCGPNARVVVRGLRAFADAGNPSNGKGHLGNMQYDRGEPLGEIPLVAEECIGPGLVQVWGDTSLFQDTTLSPGHKAVLSDFEALLRSHIGGDGRLWTGAFLLLFFLGVVASAGCEKTLMLALLGLTLAHNVPVMLVRARSQETADLSEFSVLDASHAPRYPTQETRDYIGHIYDVFIRANDLLIVRPKRITLPRPGRWLVIIAPTQPYSAGEAQRILVWVRQGGRLLVLAGAGDRKAANSLLLPAGLHIGEEPLGPCPDNRMTRQDMQTYMAQPIRWNGKMVNGSDAKLQFVEAYPVEGEGERLVAEWDKAVVVRKALERGVVVVIGDSRFATSKSLGEGFNVNVPANRFLFWLLANPRG